MKEPQIQVVELPQLRGSVRFLVLVRLLELISADVARRIAAALRSNASQNRVLF